MNHTRHYSATHSDEEEEHITYHTEDSQNKIIPHRIELREEKSNSGSLILPFSIFPKDWQKQNHHRNRRKHLQSYTFEEIQKHNTLESCWIIVDSLVLDVTKFISYHPGQTDAILKNGGTVCDESFKYHSENAKQLFWKFVIGKVQEPSDDACNHCIII